MRFLTGFFRFIPMFISLIPIFLIIGLVILVIYLIKNKVKIKLRTFKGKGFRPVRGTFGLFTYAAKQGQGKTFSMVEYLLDNKKDIVVFCNIAGIKNINYFHFTGFTELLALKKIIDFNYSTRIDLLDFIISLKTDEDKSIFSLDRAQLIADLVIEYNDTGKQLIFVYDEIFTEIIKGTKLSKEVMDFLCQMRKRKIIFLTTCQEWAELPLSYRRFCRYEIDCKMIPFLWTGILVKTFKDAENMKWSDEDQEHVAPVIETTITKCRKYIADSYDTFLRISSVNPPPGVHSTPQGEEIEKKDVNNENGISQRSERSENMPAFLFTSSK